ncbi:GNAT family N-acetyltransferase [Rhodoplanes serenus]|uniref:GNAT family N-acetyltransferase n=1 Tax=Rhodoplanes serenus TaxID=200615 RepID=UPI001FDF4C8C|nr:GNAT family N-acetyltransferase [Rhodoplanes serenus]
MTDDTAHRTMRDTEPDRDTDHRTSEQVRDNPARSRFELAIRDAVAIATYRREGDTLVFTHTEVPETLRGGGVASRLVRGALDATRSRGLRVRPVCPYVAGFIDAHSEYQDLVV